MNHSEQREWRRMTESRDGVELEGILLGVLAEGMPKRSTALVIPVPCEQHRHFHIGDSLYSFPPPAHRESPVEFEDDDYEEVAPGICQHLGDETFIDNWESVIDAEGDDWVRLSVLVDKSTIEGILAMWDHMDIPHVCEPGGDFFWAFLEKVLEQFIEGMGR